jgi:hypothetical protein
MFACLWISTPRQHPILNETETFDFSETSGVWGKGKILPWNSAFRVSSVMTLLISAFEASSRLGS